MAGTSNGFAKHMFVGSRVSTTEKNPLTYTPAYITPEQKKVSSRLVVPILINEYGQEEPDGYRLIAWAGRADMFAKNLAKGKEMHFFCTSRSYWANVYNNQGQQIMQPDGVTPVQVRQLSFTIRDFVWGSDSFNSLSAEIAAGLRPADWNIPGSPGNTAWKTLLAQRGTTFYQGGEVFGYARVVAPKRPGCQILLGDQSGRADMVVPSGATVIPGSNVPMTQQVAAALNPNPAVIPVNMPHVVAPVVPIPAATVIPAAVIDPNAIPVQVHGAGTPIPTFVPPANQIHAQVPGTVVQPHSGV